MKGYVGPGYDNRSDWNRDARFVYQHLNSASMLIWLNEAAGANPALIDRAIREMRRGGQRAQTRAMLVRRILPWEHAARLLFGVRSYSIKELLREVRRLPATTPESERLSKGGYATHRDHWIGWLEEYDGPGYYGRTNWNRDARWVYQHLDNGNIIVWLNEAAGESPALIRATITAMQHGGPQTARRAGIARSHLPWERAASLLFK